MEPLVRVFSSSGEVAFELANRLAGCLGEGGTALLAGGNSPLASYRLLAGRDDLPWKGITLVPTDERVLPQGHSQRNDTNLQSIFGRRPCTVRSLPFGTSREFEVFLMSRMPFSVTLLGLGEDGHIASLFPGNRALWAEGLVVRVHDAPKPPEERISLTLRALEATGILLFCVTGAAKKDPLERLLKGEDIPPSRLCPGGPVEVYCDRAALPK